MKQLNLLFIMSFGLLLTSCKSDDDCGPSNTTQSLISITKNYYTNNVLTSSTKFNFYYDKLINIQYSDDSYDDLYYEGDVIERILGFDANNDWEWTTTYTYNSLNQLTQKKVTPSPNNTLTNVSRQKNFAYSGNLIQSENSWSDGGFHKNIISLNNDNFITEDKMFDIGNELVNTRLFEYSNNNLTKQILKDPEENIIYEETYNYLNKIGSKEYRYSQYLFGSHWKTNSSLDKQFGLGQYATHEVSESYILDYYKHNFTLNSSVTGTFYYEFDSNDYITKQTENITSSNGETYKVITVYEYQ